MSHSSRLLTFSILFSMLCLNHASAQLSNGELILKSKAVAPVSSNELPFWLWANQYGKVNDEGVNAIQDVSYTSSHLTNSGLSFKSRFDVTLTNGINHSLNISQMYINASYKKLEGTFGRFNDIQGLNDGELGVGSMMKSRNASAMFGGRIGTNQFIEFPFTQGYFEFDFDIGHYWFDEDRYVEDVYLHSKSLYLQIDLSPLELRGGIIHNVMWGGVSPDFGQFPSTFNDYLRVVFAQGARKNSTVTGEQENSLGNTIAAFDYGILWEDDRIDLTITRLFYIEDRTGLLSRSGWDGQWSIDLYFKKPTFLRNIRYDYIYTIRQDSKNYQPDGRADYNHHYLYRTGWTYHGNVIGIPLFTFDESINQFTNNILVGHSLGFILNPNAKSEIKVIGAYTRNYGTCDDLLIDPDDICSSEPPTLLEEAIPRKEARRDTFFGFLGFSRAFTDRTTAGVSLSMDILEGEENRSGISFDISYDLFKN